MRRAFRALCALGATGTQRALLRGEEPCWGANQIGQLGIGDGDAGLPVGRVYLEPVRVPGIAGAKSLGVGEDYACAVLSDGTAVCWGNNVEGLLGHDPNLDPHCSGGMFPCNADPAPVVGLTGVREIAAGGTQTCVVRDDDTVWCWGEDDGGQLGRGIAADGGVSGSDFHPAPVLGLTGVAHLAAGIFHTCASTWDGRVFCWGDNSYGELGAPDAGAASFVPVVVEGL